MAQGERLGIATDPYDHDCSRVRAGRRVKDGLTRYVIKAVNERKSRVCCAAALECLGFTF